MQGIYSLEDLAELGCKSRYSVRRLIESGQLTRVKRGWFADSTADPLAVRALRAGLQIGCLSGCKEHGIWVPPFEEDHLIVPMKRGGIPELTGHLHRCRTSTTGPLATLRECLHQVLLFHDAETGLVVLESAVNLGRISVSEAWELIRLVPKRKQHQLRFFTPSAQSGSETRVRYFLQRHRIPVFPQVYIPSVGRVDLVVGNSLIIECDSRAHHSAERDYQIDRTRDFSSMLSGRETVRLGYWQIWHTWEETSEGLLVKARNPRYRRIPKAIA